jgi:hypothetical protein
LRMYDTGFCILRPENSSAPQQPTLTRLDLRNGAIAEENPDAFFRLSGAIVRQYSDGLYNIKNVTKIVEVKLYKTFTHLAVEYLK